MRTAAPTLILTLAVSLIASDYAQAEIAWQTNLRTAHAQAQKEGKLLLLHFFSDNCTWCERLEKGSFQAPQVGEAISESFVPVKIHANTNAKLAEMFKVSKFPTDVIVTTEGKTLAHSVSPQNPDRYVAMLTNTLPQIASKPEDEPKPDDPTLAQNSDPNDSIASLPAPSQASVPGYAASAAPSEVDPVADATQVASRKGVAAQFAAARSDGLTLEMPGQVTEQTAPKTNNFAVPDSFAAPVVEPQAAAAAVAPPVAPPSQQATVSVSEPAAAVASDQPELAMQGFCAVTVIGEDKWVEGKPEFGVIHLGKLYLFDTEAKMKMFLADPVPYTPVLNEIDVVRFFEERKIVPGKREWGLKDPIYNRMFFFADEAAMEHFYNEYERYTDAAIEVMDKAVKDANPGT